MFDIQGRFTSARVYAETVDGSAIGQITAIAGMPYMKDARIAIMPDAHAGAGCVVGTTVDIRNRPVCPNLVGCDIGCGMLAIRLEQAELDLAAVDRAIHEHVPAGTRGNPKQSGHAGEIDLYELKCAAPRSVNKAKSALGTLGGGNHFIEIDRDEDGVLYLVIHSGSRSLGIAVLNAYMPLARSGRDPETGAWIPPGLACLEGTTLDDYLHDVAITQAYASLNRSVIAETVMSNAGLTPIDSFETVHNYIDLDAGILRKGAISAERGERVLIPMNMRDGGLICKGLGNPEWNMSAPHGAGRLMSRAEAKQSISLDEYEKSMAGIYTSCVGQATIDESPMAYKPAAEIERLVEPTVEVVKRLRPVYNFKAGG